MGEEARAVREFRRRAEQGEVQRSAKMASADAAMKSRQRGRRRDPNT